MSEMVERVAKAMLRDELANGNRDFEVVWADESAVWLANARVAIGAMRQPTMLMKMAGAKKVTAQRCGPNPPADYDAASDAWQAMIDEALATPLNDGEGLS